MATEHERGAVGICRAIEAICNRGELAVADALFTPDYINHGGLIPDLVRGPEALKVAAALYRAAFPDYRVGVAVLRARGATVLLRWAAGWRDGDHARAPRRWPGGGELDPLGCAARRAAIGDRPGPGEPGRGLAIDTPVLGPGATFPRRPRPDRQPRPPAPPPPDRRGRPHRRDHARATRREVTGVAAAT